MPVISEPTTPSSRPGLHREFQVSLAVIVFKLCYTSLKCPPPTGFFFCVALALVLELALALNSEICLLLPPEGCD
ncbi:hypothetical protein ACRRTK_003071 [Alexandromys fortis]